MRTEREHSLAEGMLKKIEELGSGSFGVTWRAEVVDEHLAKRWDRFVAVKIPLGKENQPAIISDVVNMARIQGALSVTPNPPENLVHFYGCGLCDGYYVMVCEYVAGTDLEKRLAPQSSARRISSEQALDWTVQICEALSLLHKARIYHRDIKPSNILLRKTEGAYRVKVADFGLSVALDYGKEWVSNSRKGALAYTPPEYMIHPDIPIRASYDLYSVGLILYQLCCNALPFKRLDAWGVPSEATRLDEPYRHPHEINIEVPDFICDIIMKAVAKKPEDRYQSADGMLKALRSAREKLDRPAAPPVPENVARRLAAIRESLDSETAKSLSARKAEQVERELLTLIKANPDVPDIYIALGQFYKKHMGDLEKAIEALEAGLKQAPENPLLLYHLGEAIMRRQGPSSAAKRQALNCLMRAIQNGLPNPMQVKMAKRLVTSLSRKQ